MRNLIRPGKAAEKLAVSATTLWRYTKNPDFPRAYRIGPNVVAFDEGELDTWLASRRASVDAAERADFAVIAGR